MSEVIVLVCSTELIIRNFCVLFFRFIMENSPGKDLSAKRTHVPSGTTPSKPEKKRVRNTSSPATRKTLFSSKSASPVTSDKHSSKSPNRKVSGK